MFRFGGNKTSKSVVITSVTTISLTDSEESGFNEEFEDRMKWMSELFREHMRDPNFPKMQKCNCFKCIKCTETFQCKKCNKCKICSKDIRLKKLIEINTTYYEGCLPSELIGDKLLNNLKQ